MSNIISAGSERGILSICLKSPDMLIECENKGLMAEHFGIEANKLIFLAMSYLYSKRIKPTQVSLMEVMPDDNSKKTIDDIGGLVYLSNLLDTSMPEDSLSIFVEKVIQSYTRRKVIEICTQATEFMESDKANVLNPSELIEEVDNKLINLSSNSQQIEDVYKFGDDTDAVLIERAETPEAVPGLETGWKQFDKVTNGGQPGDLIFVSARSKTGKSVALLNWSIQMGIIDQLPILYIDTEMSSREQEDRILANLSGVPHSEIVSGMYVLDTDSGLAVEKMEKLNKAKEQMKRGKLYHIYMPTFTLEKISALVRKFQMQHGIVALFFDYLKFPASQMASLKTAQEWQMLGFLASGLKDLAGTLKIPIYSAVQENRSDGDKGGKKSFTNIGGSDRILQLATKLVFLYNKTDEEIARTGIMNGNQWLYVAYQRNGESDCNPISILFNRPYLKQMEC